MEFMMGLSATLGVTIILVSLLLMKKYKPTRELSSPFECGFDPTQILRNPLSVRFFFIMLMFLIFDIEIVLLLPIPISTFYSGVQWILISIFFLTILVMGLIMEWKMGTIKWA